MDEYIGNRHVRMAGTVVDVVPGGRIVWQLKRVVRLPVWLTLELTDRDGAVAIRHTIRAGYTEEFGPAAADTVTHRMLAGYVALAPAVPALRAPMSRLTLRIAVDSLVLYRALPDELAKDTKLALISRSRPGWMDTALARWIYAHRIPHLILRRLWFLTANWLDEPDGWRFR